MSFAEFIEDKISSLELHTLSESHPLGHEIDKFAKNNPGGIKGFVESLGTWAKGHPGNVLSILHAIRPVLSVKNITIVTSYEGVKDVLGRDGDFAVTYGQKMEMITENAGFFLGMDDSLTKGFTDRSNMQMLFRRDDIPTIVKPLIDKLCQSKLEKLKPGFDLVSDYLQFIPAEFAIQYFGFSKIQKEWLYETTAGLFEYLFIDVTDNPIIAKRAEFHAKEIREKLDIEISLASAPADTVLGRGLALHKAGVPGFDPVNLRNNMIGLLIGLVPTTSKSAVMAYDYATSTDERAVAFKEYFKSSDDKSFQAYVRELTRINPINPGLFRKAIQDTTISSGGKTYKIPKGNMVFIGTYTAMRDKNHILEPVNIIPDRPDSAYLTYGYGLHACFGRYINDLHVSSLLYNCFKHGFFYREDGSDGDLVFDGAFPAHLKLKIQTTLE
jgi:cytochrome P450